MRILFVVAIFLGSALLFLVQPMAAKMLLPSYGGTPAVWNTSMLFFQAALLLGYGYAHLSFRWLGPKVQPIAHLAFLALAFMALPIQFGAMPSLGGPSVNLLMQLAVGVGLPFVAVSAGAPLLQRWYATTGAKDAKDPYSLYAASNVASILALVAYPFFVEPFFRLGDQGRGWMAGFGALVILIALCAVGLIFSRKGGDSAPAEESPKDDSPPIAGKTIGLWIALAAVPSSLLLGVTTYLTTNLASAPLLWVVPLALYLLTFVIAFSRRRLFDAAFYGRLAAMLMAPMVLVIVLEAADPIVALALLHLLIFTLGALACHSRLYESRPNASHLTAFYFWISVGGVVGGLFNALLAPMVFKSIAEYPIALVGLIVLIPSAKPGPIVRADFLLPLAVGAFTVVAVIACETLGIAPSPLRTGVTLGIPALVSFAFAERPLRYGLALGAVFLAAHLMGIGATGRLLRTERSFFGVHRVLLTENGRFRELMHGNTIHGRQSTEAAQRDVPLTYYYSTGPIGHTFQFLGQRLDRVALVGMGVGSLAAYGREGQRFTFYEIDPDVVEISRDSGLFTFIKDSKATIDVALGDARLSLAKSADKFDLIVLDAFSSDAIPMHLLTLEAIRMYREKLKPDGVIAFHISNRYLDLRPVLAAAARALGLGAMIEEDLLVEDAEREAGKFPSTWIVMAPSADALKPFHEDPRWEVLTEEARWEPWTDDFSNIIEAYREKARERE